MEPEIFTDKIQTDKEAYKFRRRNGRSLIGIFLLGIGGLLLLNTLNLLLFPSWLFTWPVLLIAIGLFSLAKDGLRGGYALIMILVGAFFLIDRLDPSLKVRRYIAPVAVIAVGVGFLINRNKKGRTDYPGGKRLYYPENNTETAGFAGSGDGRDYVDITSIFGGVKKNITTKTFRGGDVVSFMGGSEINMTQADFTGRITLDATNIFGGTKIIVPPNWDVQSDVVNIFGGVDDKRQIGNVPVDRNKLLIIDGVCIFGGIEIRSF